MKCLCESRTAQRFAERFESPLGTNFSILHIHPASAGFLLGGIA